jgi:Domain of unknown function (DUF4389)
MSATTYPVKVDAELDAPLSRWLWAVKWLLAIPHYVVLGFLWIAFVVLSAAAFFAIVWTGRYPRSIFDFNVGVLRWTWRVQYYAYGALGTDKYPPFSLKEDPGYPAHLAIDYPERLSRGLALIKWWLLAIPHYIIVGLFVGGGAWAAMRLGDQHGHWAGGGLIGILVLIAAITLAITGRYPDSIFGFVLGMNRWVLRVAAYAALMTDEYPPFRFDAGGADPGTVIVDPAAEQAGGTSPTSPSSNAGLRQAEYASRPSQSGRTSGRIACLVVGALLLLPGTGLLAGGAGTLWADQAKRQGSYIASDSMTYTTTRRALVSDAIRVPGSGLDGLGRQLIGLVRIRVTATKPRTPVFVGLARMGDVRRYLAGVQHTTIGDLASAGSATDTWGTRVPAVPANVPIWTVSSAGPGTQTIVTTITRGAWTIVVMNPDASPGLTVRADVAATAPGLPWVAGGLLAAGVLVLAGAVLLIGVAVRRSSGRLAAGGELTS